MSAVACLRPADANCADPCPHSRFPTQVSPPTGAGEAKKSAGGAPKVDGPPAPKKARSAYIIFGSDRRDSLKKEQPELGFTDITKVIAGEWNALSSEAKKPYQDRAAEEKAAKAADVAAAGGPARPSTSSKVVKASSSKASTAKEEHPSSSAWTFFRAENKSRAKEDNPGFSIVQIDKVRGR